MANENYPLKSYALNGWTITKRDGLWTAISKKGQIGTTNVSENSIKLFAAQNDANK